MARLLTVGGETGSAEWNGITNRVVHSTTIKRTGSYSLKMDGVGSVTSNQGYFRHVFGENETELYGRFALYLDNAASSERDLLLVRFRDENNASQFNLQYNLGTACLGWYNGAGTLLALGNVTIPATTWVVVEFHIQVNAAGQVVAKVNGTTDASFAGDTDYTGTGNVRAVWFMGLALSGGATGSHAEYFDDIAINDTDGSYENSWPGLGGVFWLEPTADGAQNDWTPSSGTVNYAMVDDIPPDNATTYNQALDSASIDLYEVDDCPEYIAEVNLVQVAYRAALVTSGYNELTDLVRVGTVNYSGYENTIVPITPSFTYYLGTPYYLNPSSGSAWGTAEINAMQVGVEITT